MWAAEGNLGGLFSFEGDRTRTRQGPAAFGSYTSDMSTLMQDLKHAVRSLRRSPGFAAVVVLTLALGIGANTAIFTIVNAAVLKPLAYPQPDQLVRVTSELRKFGANDTGTAALELFDYQSRTDLFSGVAGIYPVNANLTGGSEPERIETLLVTWNYFSILGATPKVGRVFDASDDGPGIPPVSYTHLTLPTILRV